MKNLLFAAVAAVVLSGCCSYCNINTKPTQARTVDGEKVLATFYVQNVSHQLFACIPLNSGVTWQKGGVEHADDWSLTWFEDKATLDENMKCLDHACDIVGSHRITAISHNINENPFWSFFILNRRQIKTECLILEPKKKDGAK